MGRKKNDRIKRAHEKTEYTVEQIQELQRCAEDVVYFCKKYVKVRHPVRGSIPFVLYPYQEKMMKLYQENRFSVVLSARQTGKSQTSAIFLLWYALFHEDKTILIASNKNAGAMEMIYRIQYAYEELPSWLKPGVTEDGWNKHAVGFDNGSRIISTATSEDSGRGMSISLLFLDEFAFVPPNVQEAFWTSISPTLSTGGSCIVTSTPNGDSNLFAQIWRSAECGNLVGESEQNIAFVPFRVKWDEPPGRDDKFKQQQIAILGELKWRQEFECEFLSSDALLIDSTYTAMLENRAKGAASKVINGITFWKDPKPGETYLVAVDPATGSGNDFSVIECFHFPSLEQVAEFRSNTMSTSVIYPKLKWLLNLFDGMGATCYFSVENNGVGEGLISLFVNDETPPNFAELVSESGGTRLGMNTNVRTKIKACINFKEMVEKGRVTIYSKLLLTELKNFVRRRGSYQAQTGSTDDCIAACLVITRILEEISSFEQGAFEKLYTYEEERGAYRLPSENNDDQYDDPMPMIFG